MRRFLETTGLDLLYACRALRKNAPLTATALVTLTLGIGLNAGVFSLINAISLRARIDTDPDSYVRIFASHTTARGERAPWQDPNIDEYMAFRQAQSVYKLTAWTQIDGQLGNSSATPVRGLLTTCNFFDLYTVKRPKLGCLLHQRDCAEAQSVIVISEEIWSERYSSDPAIVGKVVYFNGQPLTVVGVSPSPFAGRVNGARVWFPYTMRSSLKREPYRDTSGPPPVDVAGRLTSGFSREQAASELAVLANSRDYVIPDQRTDILVTDGSSIQMPGIRDQAVWALPLVIGGCSLVLVIASANVATLYLSRAVARRREIAVRLALGAGGMRLLRMLLTEHVLLAVLACLPSVYLAYIMPPLLYRFLIKGDTVTFSLYPDWRVFTYLASVALISAVLSGLAPAFQALDRDISDSLKGRHNAFRGLPRSASRANLIAVQVGLSVILLAAAGTFVRAYQKVVNVSSGIDTREVLVLTLQWNRPPASWSAFHKAFADRIMSLPGALEVAYAGRRPFEPGSLVVRAPGRHSMSVQTNIVSANYFKALGIPIVNGRSLQVSDFAATGGVGKAVVSERLARNMWRGQNALGRTLLTPDGSVLEVVGIARDTAVSSIGQPDEPTIYQPWDRDSGPLYALVRFAGDGRRLSAAVRSAVLQAFPGAAIDVRTVQSHMDERTAGVWKLTSLLALLAIGALVLAAIGIYGLVCFDAKQRTKEIGIRVALGANTKDIVYVMVVRCFVPVGTGLGLGLLMAVPICVAVQTALNASFVDPTDPLAYAGVSALLVLAALAAIGMPALRAASSQPMMALREE
jgi:predicted permease